MNNSRRRVGIYDDINAIKRQLAERRLAFKELDYNSNSPIYEDENEICYTVQGFADIGVVCSLSGEALNQLKH